MSLINDALKRASQTAKDRPSQANLPTPMEPVQESPRPKSNYKLGGISAVILIVAVAGWFLFQWFHQRHARNERVPAVAATPNPQRPPVAANGLQATATAPPRPLGNPAVTTQGIVHSAPPASPPPASPASSGGVASSPNPPVSAVSTPPPPVAAPSPSPAPATPVLQSPRASQVSISFPNLQVKGIFYNKSHPYALINGETVGEGEEVLGVRIVKIQPNRVTLELNGHTKQLVLGE